MAENPNYQEFLEYVVKNIVAYPDQVKIDRKVDEMGVLLTLKVAPEDVGKIIGRKGATARALRSLLRIVGMKTNARVNLKIEEPEGSRVIDSNSSAPSTSTIDEVMEGLNEEK